MTTPSTHSRPTSSNAQAKLERGFLTPNFVLRMVKDNAKLEPSEQLKQRSARELGYTHPEHPRIAWALGAALSALAGVVFWTPFLQTWLEDLGLDLRFVGAAVSLAIMVAAWKALTVFFLGQHQHRDLRGEQFAALAFTTLLALGEAAAIALGLSGQHTGLLDANAKYLPYLAGATVTAINMATAMALARIHARRATAEQRAMTTLGLEPHASEVKNAYVELEALLEQAQREIRAEALPTVQHPTTSAANTQEVQH